MLVNKVLDIISDFSKTKVGYFIYTPLQHLEKKQTAT